MSKKITFQDYVLFVFLTDGVVWMSTEKKTRGVKWALVTQFLSKYSSVAVQLVLNALLARLLSPEEFGLLAIINVFTAFFALFADMGVGPAIIQFEDLGDDNFRALFSVSAVLGVVLSVFFCLSALPISWFYGDARLLPLCFAISPSILFNTLNMVPNGVMLRNKMFASVGKRLFVSTLVAGVFATLLAFMGAGAYALAANTVAQAFIILLWNLKATGLWFGRMGILSSLRRVFRYSAFQFGFSFINYFSRNLDNLFIGRFMGVSQLGYYDKAYKLTTYPLTGLSSIVGSVLQPYLARCQTDLSLLYRYWLRTAKLLSLVAVPIAACLFVFSDLIVFIIYGEQWGESAILLRALSVSVYFQIINNPTGSVFQSTGRTDYLFMHSIFSTGITVIGLAVGLYFGSSLSVAIGISVAYVMHTASICYFLIYKTFRGNPFTYLGHFIPEAIVGVVGVMFSLSIGLVSGLSEFSLIALEFVVLTIVLLLGYIATGQINELKRALNG